MTRHRPTPVLLASFLTWLVASTSATFTLGPEETMERRWKVPCSAQYVEDPAVQRKRGCSPLPGGACDRVVVDSFLNPQEVAILVRIAEKGMSTTTSKKGATAAAVPLGPTIMDVNSGWVLPSGAHQPSAIYAHGPLFTEQEFEAYGRITQRLKKLIEAEYELSSLFFTAPTFITREAAGKGGGGWEPTTMHDEYWHPHVDKNNTAHYDYSGLVYLSTQGADFEGGTLEFYDAENLDCSPFMDEDNPGPCVPLGDPSLALSPRAGRAIVFGSGRENPHRVTRVTDGTRYVLSFWFTCDSRREMKSFLDGKMHVRFEGSESQGSGSEL